MSDAKLAAKNEQAVLSGTIFIIPATGRSLWSQGYFRAAAPGQSKYNTIVFCESATIVRADILFGSSVY
ncbi:MAG TPA: hypothetical protein VKQ27_15690 [Acetobacteraceae bacterium]|nr:hypothetical protein [Acetobacteraceae bacterium]